MGADTFLPPMRDRGLSCQKVIGLPGIKGNCTPLPSRPSLPLHNEAKLGTHEQ